MYVHSFQEPPRLSMFTGQCGKQLCVYVAYTQKREACRGRARLCRVLCSDWIGVAILESEAKSQSIKLNQHPPQVDLVGRRSMLAMAHVAYCGTTGCLMRIQEASLREANQHLALVGSPSQDSAK